MTKHNEYLVVIFRSEYKFIIHSNYQTLPGGSVGKESACKNLPEFDAWVGKILCHKNATSSSPFISIHIIALLPFMWKFWGTSGPTGKAVLYPTLPPSIQCPRVIIQFQKYLYRQDSSGSKLC